MAKRIICFILCCSVIFLTAVPAFADVVIPDTASELVVSWTPRFVYKYNEVWYSADVSRALRTVGGDFYTSVIFSESADSSFYTLEDLTTYYFQIELEVSKPEYVLMNLSTYLALSRAISVDHVGDVFGDTSSDLVTSVGFTFNESDEYSYLLGDYVEDMAYSVSTLEYSTVTVSVVFTTKGGVSSANIGALAFFMGYSLSGVSSISITDFSAYYDPSMSVFESYLLEFSKLNYEALLQILGSVDATNEKLEDIKGQLEGSADDYQDNSGFDDAASDLENVEGEINDKIFAPVAMPDGSTVEMDADIFTNFRDYLYDTYDPQDYEASAGKEINKVFETFMPYVGVVVFLNLLLGVAVAFLRGRSNA